MKHLYRISVPVRAQDQPEDQEFMQLFLFRLVVAAVALVKSI